MSLKHKTLSRRSTVLVPLSLVLGLSLGAAVSAEPVGGATAKIQTTTATSDDATPVERRVKSCAAPCRHKPSGLR
jgi:hypothetical protein